MFVGHWPRRLGHVDDIRRGCTCTADTYRGCARIGPMCVWNKSLGLLCLLSRRVGEGGKAAVVKMKSLFSSMYCTIHLNIAMPPLSPYFAFKLIVSL